MSSPEPKPSHRFSVPGRESVLARLHSECRTGDALGSLRCDCGDQLVAGCARSPMRAVAWWSTCADRRLGHRIVERVACV
ncbi:hypothetical protein AB0L63_04780 [Nocardia sp. NPDC051990]|uniref:hypothetical protein n=1 Tax=Nocardia sp. NPDC051990 TaxID=3155285 RepID=UPI00343E36F3